MARSSPLLSVLIPARHEPYLGQTVTDLLTHAAGPIEVIVVLDGHWPDPPLPAHPALTVVHWSPALGMRPALNAAATLAHGQYLLKADAHTAWAEGFDVTLTAACEDDWLVVPRRYSLDVETWTRKPKPPVDAHFLAPPDVDGALKGRIWPERATARADVLLDDEMTSQGSAWLMSRRHWDRLGGLDVATWGASAFQEIQELGLKTWASGGAMKVNKRTWYAHWHKPKSHGRGYPVSRAEVAQAIAGTRSRFLVQQPCVLRRLVDRFAPVPGWPVDVDGCLQEHAA